jgi:hypothetical protein
MRSAPVKWGAFYLFRVFLFAFTQINDILARRTGIFLKFAIAALTLHMLKFILAVFEVICRKTKIVHRGET